jgi:hypothetical protein
VKGVLTMGKPIDANGTQGSLGCTRIDQGNVEKTVLRLWHRIFMAVGEEMPMSPRPVSRTRL